MSAMFFAGAVVLASAAIVYPASAQTSPLPPATYNESINAEPIITTGLPSLSGGGLGYSASTLNDLSVPSISVQASADAPIESMNVEAAASVTLNYSIEFLGNTSTVPVTVNLSGNVDFTGTGTNEGGDAQATIGIVDFLATCVTVASSDCSRSFSADSQYIFSTNVVYSVQLSAGVTVISEPGNPESASAFVDPTYSVPTGYSIVTSAGIGNGVPEPSTWAMMLLGFAALGFVGYRRVRRLAAPAD
jgi:hypothetical protein